MTEPTTTTFALLALLAVRSWTGYELTQQARRSLRYAWPRSEANLYVEQKRLVRLGWASTSRERTGRRPKTRYEITATGRAALAAWLATEPAPPRFEIEGVVRLLFAEHGSVDDLRAALEATASHAREALDDGLEQAREYLETGGPFPERLNLISLSAVWFADSLALIEEFCLRTTEAISDWDDAGGPLDHAAARRRIEDLLERHERSARSAPAGPRPTRPRPRP